MINPNLLDMFRDPMDRALNPSYSPPNGSGNLGTPGINPNAGPSELDRLIQILQQGTQEQGEIRSKSANVSPKNQSPLPRPGALGIAALVDLLSGGKGRVLGNFVGGFGQGAEYQNQQSQAEAQRQQAELQAQLMNSQANQKTAVDVFGLKQDDERFKLQRQDKIEDRDYSERKFQEQQQAMTARNDADNQRMLEQEGSRNMRAAIAEHNRSVAKLLVENGGIPDELFSQIKANEEAIRTQYPNAQGFTPVTRGDTLKGKQIRETIKNTSSIINDRNVKRRAQLEKWKKDAKRDSDRTGIMQKNSETSRMQANTSRGNLSQRKAEFDWRKKEPKTGISQLDKLETQARIDLAAQQRIVNMFAAAEDIESPEYVEASRKLGALKAELAEIKSLRSEEDVNGIDRQVNLARDAIRRGGNEAAIRAEFKRITGVDLG